jgi:hypothetical protein
MNLLGRQNKQTVVNELNVIEDHLTSPEEFAKGFNNHFQILAQIWPAKLILQITILKHISRMLNQNLLHFSLLLSVVSVVS